jgi:Nif-specific regulatory protein
MTPRLILLDGPSKGQVTLFDRQELSIGRHPGNHLVLGGELVSRHHCRILAGPSGDYLIRDLQSRNGIFVNGVPAHERALAHGDTIRIGDTHILFLTEDQPPDAGENRSVRLDSASRQTATMVELPRLDSLYLTTGDLPRDPRATQSLQALLKISTVIRSADGLKPLAHQLLGLIAEATSAHQAAILLTAPQPADPLSFSWDKTAGFETIVTVPDHLLKRAARDGIATLAQEDSSCRIAAPLASRDQLIGALYLETPGAFDDDHLQFATAAGSIGGLALDSARRLELLAAENTRLREEINLEHDMVGESPRMQEVYRFLSRAAPTSATVLIRGESGTGKELVARAIHRNSPRAQRPFIAVNCAALTEPLLESELFGHERGAFTHAIAQKKGRFELADGGTLFLDEVGEIPISLQAKLLRAIEEREFERVGGTRSIRVDVRLIAATNADLKAAIEKGTFRQDLYYRLDVLSLTMPPLRERTGDVQLLATYVASRVAAQTNKKINGISPDARAILEAYDWPGNVRELRNAIERAVVLGNSEYILPEDLPEDLLESSRPAPEALGQFRSSVTGEKRRLILEAICHTRGNYTEAAHRLGVHPNYLHRLIRNLDLKEEILKALGK